MKKLFKQQIEQINELLRKGQALPEEYKNLLFESKKEYELVYGGKEREEDIIAETMAVPLQPVKTLGKDGVEWENKLIFGDNLQVLKTLYNDPEVKGKVKLIYIDPPFATKQEFRGSKEQKAYQDKLAGAKFLEFLRKRLVLLHKILSDDGVIYLHLDYRKVHYAKVLLDEIFGEENFLNEIIWAYKERETSTRFYNRKHDTVLFYAKNASFHTFNADLIRDEYSAVTVSKFKYRDKDGRRYRLRYKDGRSDPPKEGPDTYRQYFDEVGGTLPRDWFILPFVNQAAEERTLFPTQKPEALLARFIKASSNEDDVILDAFAGSGTTLAVAEKLKRRWIGIDCGKLAIYTMQKRMLNLKTEIGNKGKSLIPKPFTVYNAGLYDYKLIKDLPWPEYRNFALKLFQCRDEEHKASGVKLNGYLGEDHVLVFQWHDGGEIVLDRGFIDDLHKTLGKKIGQRFYIIAPASTVVFLEDYIEKDGTKYYILRIPYSIIEEIHEKGFESIKQPVSEADVNDVVDAVGFDFIQTPDVECEYKIRKAEKKSLFDGDKEAVIKIKKFKSNVLSRKPVEFKNLETLSMVMVDYNFNGEVFDIDQYWFAESLDKDGYEIRFDPKKVEKQMMIIYMDIFGNEKREIKTLKDFKG